MTKPKLAPAKPAALETPPTPPPQESEQPHDGDAGATENPADSNNEAPQVSTEPMEINKPEAPKSSVECLHFYGFLMAGI